MRRDNPTRGVTTPHMAATRQAKNARTRPAELARDWLTSARRRELLGAVLVVTAVVTLVSFRSQGGVVTDVWTSLLVSAFGWGAPLFALVLGVVGTALILDAADGDARLPWHQAAGAIAFHLCLVSLFHLVVASRPDAPPAAELARVGAGGGWAGYALAEGLRAVLGPIPAGIALLAASAVTLATATAVPLRDLGTESARLFVGLGRRIARLRAPDYAELDLGPDPFLPPPAPPEPARDPVGEEPAAVEPGPSSAAAGATPEDPITPRREKGQWRLPKIGDVLDPPPAAIRTSDDAEAKARLIEDTLAEFGVPVQVVEIQRGPSVTQFGVEPGYAVRAGKRARVRVSRIMSLQNDLALALAASPLRIQAPVPGRPYVGIEVPNSAAAMVTLRGVIESDNFKKVMAKGGLPVALGRDTAGNAVAADLAAMPHLLIAGTTGSGKSVALNGIVCSLLVANTPDRLKMILVDPKRVELPQLRGLPPLGSPVVVDIERVVGVLQWAVREMDRRYKAFAEKGARNLQLYNEIAARLGEEPMPYLVLIIDELADLMMVAPEEVERLVARLAQLARATGIHLIIATQRPSVDVVTGLIKANFPSRIAFAVASSIDSRVILDSVGAEKLLGKGDMLYMASDSSKLHRLQGCFVSDKEVEKITRYWRSTVSRDDTDATEESGAALDAPAPLIQPELWQEMLTREADDTRDPLWKDALDVLRQHDSASTSFLQRKLRIGYSRAARLIDTLEELGYIGPAQGNQPREIRVEFDDEGNILEPAAEQALTATAMPTEVLADAEEDAV